MDRNKKRESKLMTMLLETCEFVTPPTMPKTIEKVEQDVLVFNTQNNNGQKRTIDEFNNIMWNIDASSLFRKTTLAELKATKLCFQFKKLHHNHTTERKKRLN